MNMKKKTREQNINDEIQKGTNYCLKETESFCSN